MAKQTKGRRAGNSVAAKVRPAVRHEHKMVSDFYEKKLEAGRDRYLGLQGRYAEEIKMLEQYRGEVGDLQRQLAGVKNVLQVTEAELEKAKLTMTVIQGVIDLSRSVTPKLIGVNLIVGGETGEQTQAIRKSYDLPTCSDCGAAMVLDGVCFKCPNCGGTSGSS